MKATTKRQSETAVTETARRGAETAGDPLPFVEQIQRAFGRHDVTGVRASVGGDAAGRIGAEAYAMGERVVFGQRPTLRVAAHEAAHVVQQRQGVSVSVGSAGDAYERHADQVADMVVSGRSAEGLLDRIGGGSATVAVQRTPLAEQIANAQRPLAGGARWDAEADGTMRTDDPIVANATRAGGDVEPRPGTPGPQQSMVQQLQTLSRGFTQASPALQAWVDAIAAVNTVAGAGGIDLTSRAHLRMAGEVLSHMGEQMHNTRDRTGARVSETLERHRTSARAIDGATSSLRAAMSRVQSVRAELDSYLASLRRARVAAERDGIQARIDRAIAIVQGLIRAAFSISTALVRGTSGLSLAVGCASTANGISDVGSTVAQTVAGAFVDIDGMQSQVATLNREIAEIDEDIQGLDTTRLTARLTSAHQGVEAARSATEDLQSSYFNGMTRAGRIYDQQDRTPREAQRRTGPTARPNETFSAEAVLGLVAALQQRRHARQVFGDVLARNPIIRGPNSRLLVRDFRMMTRRSWVVQRDQPRLADEPGPSSVVARVPMDYQDRNGRSPFTAAEVARGRQLWRMANNVWDAADRYDRVHQSHEAIEQAWLALANRSTGGRIH